MQKEHLLKIEGKEIKEEMSTVSLVGKRGEERERAWCVNSSAYLENSEIKDSTKPQRMTWM